MKFAMGETPALKKPIAPQLAPMPSMALVFEVSQFLYREARILDEERYEEWLGMMTDDIHYWMPGIQARHRKDKTPRLDPKRMAFFDDDMLNLRRRVTRFMDPTAWAEDPPTRACHVISNIEVEMTDKPDEFKAYSAFINCRGRGEAEEFWLTGRRSDILRRSNDGTLRIASREIVITQTVLLAKNLNVFL
ncbi:3-phenylpropionate/cinnamic acid dioxygenase subunit beta [Limnohabitans sp. Rim11]|uniref:3-phenylpropionate/cinnamic acid dioxygenase subunit beta n=1 Tax=Limnohabitans sp. Rim11 TaxID=1100719 RepID=UPI000A753170|nr:3-phenylpropionate/cinnamic acid dioxygenase subunit beta [Limnohabitans sp. Rim11]